MDSTQPEAVTLKNSATECKQLVATIMLSLENLMQEKPIAFYDLVLKARDPNYRFFGNTDDDLKAMSLVQADGTLHDSIRNIVLSAVDGENANMRLTSPTRPPAAPVATT